MMETIFILIPIPTTMHLLGTEVCRFLLGTAED